MGEGELVKEVLQHFEAGLEGGLRPPEEAPELTNQLLVLLLGLGDTGTGCVITPLSLLESRGYGTILAASHTPSLWLISSSCTAPDG